MSRIDTSSTSAAVSGKTTDLRDVDMNQFLTLMITELQNQDPLNPTSNADFLQQVSTIRQIGSTNQLTDSLNAMTMGQNLGTASSLIGKKVTALSDDNKNVEGLVERVSIAVDKNDDSKRSVTVHVGGTPIQLKNVREILDAPA